MAAWPLLGAVPFESSGRGDWLQSTWCALRRTAPGCCCPGRRGAESGRGCRTRGGWGEDVGGRKRPGIESFWSPALQRSPTARLSPTCGVPRVSKIVFTPRHCPPSRYLAQRAGCVRPGSEPLTPVSPLVSAEPHVRSRKAEITPGGRRCPQPPQEGPSAPDSAQDTDTATQENLLYSRFPKAAAARG